MKYESIKYHQEVDDAQEEIWEARGELLKKNKELASLVMDDIEEGYFYSALDELRQHGIEVSLWELSPLLIQLQYVLGTLGTEE